MNDTPALIPGAYWVRPARLAAGPHPAALDATLVRDFLGELLHAGITTFVDLTTPGEIPDYRLDLRQEAARHTVNATYHRRPLPDMATPQDTAQMIAILDTIDAALAQEETVYVHCFAGLGRTGTVIGCWLARHGTTGQAALQELRRLRGGEYGSPQTDEQARFVRAWRENT